MLHANKLDLCSITFFPLENVYWSSTAMQISGDRENLTNHCQHLKTAWLNTETLVMAANFNLDSSFSPSQKLPNPKYSSSAGSYMRICNRGVMFLLLWVILFCVWRSVFHMFKSSNLTKETDNWSLVSANDCLLMLYANTHLWLWDAEILSSFHLRSHNRIFLSLKICAWKKSSVHLSMVVMIMY